ncbi:MAG: M48 family metallopeptidase [Actinomycetota bacterium]|nr:M48 family metallopeptidase [Actinomycetota bacterium]
MGGHRSRTGVAVAAAILAAGATTAILHPRSGLIDPSAIDLRDYFSEAELRRAEDFRGLQRLIGVGGLVISGATLALLAVRPPAPVRRLLERAGENPVRGAALVAAGISLTLTVTGIPLSMWAHERAVDYGLATQSLGAWFGDVAKSAAIGVVIAAIGGAVGIALIRRFPTRWWIPAAGVVTGFAAIVLYLTPVLIDPLFNRFEPLRPGALRSDVLRLADRAGVDVGEVYRVDASRRTTAINAYVGGLGPTKRVVLYDNLIEDYPEEQLRSVVAHELGHVKNSDLPRGLLWVAIVALPGMLAVQRLTEAMGGRSGRPAVLPALALSLGLVSFGLTCAGNALSRPVEARADAYALELTGDPEAFIALERSLTLRNLGDPDPPALLHALFGTHPTAAERLGYGETVRRRGG